MNKIGIEESKPVNPAHPKLNLPMIRYYGSLEDEDLITNLTCFQACLYYLLKTELKCDDDDIVEIFLRDLTFGIEVTPAGLINEICFQDTTLNECGFKKHYLLGKGLETFAEIEALLNEGKAVVVQTCMQRVPFFKDFKSFDYPLDEEYYKANYQWQHTFLVIGHDREYVYYVEGPYNLNKERYIPYPGNPTIGVIEKAQLLPAFDAFLNYTYLDIDMGQMKEMFDVVKTVTGKSIAGYLHPPRQTEKYTYYYGKEAMDRLFGHMCSDSFDINQYIPQHSITLGELLIWKTQFVSNRRMMLAKAFSKHLSRFDIDNINPKIEMLKRSTRMWRTVQANMIKMQVKKTSRIGSDFDQLLGELAALEGEIIEELKTIKFH